MEYLRLFAQNLLPIFLMTGVGYLFAARGQPRGPWVDPRGRVFVEPQREAPPPRPGWTPHATAPRQGPLWTTRPSASGRRVVVVWRQP